MSERWRVERLDKGSMKVIRRYGKIFKGGDGEGNGVVADGVRLREGFGSGNCLELCRMVSREVSVTLFPLKDVQLQWFGRIGPYVVGRAYHIANALDIQDTGIPGRDRF
jgi:hypothetical protein